MNYLLRFFCTVCFTVYPLTLMAYSQLTHQEISEVAANASVLSDSDVLSDIGLSPIAV